MNGYRQTSCSQAIFNKVFMGGCGQNVQKIEENVLTYFNVTTPTPVPKPGSRNSGGTCDCTVEFNSSASGTVWASAYLNTAEWWQTASLNQDMLGIQTFQSSSTRINMGKCQEVGFKVVAANLMWGGTFGFTSNDACNTTQSIAADQRKYITASFDDTWDVTPGTPTSGFTIHATLNGNTIVDPLTLLKSTTMLSTEQRNDGFAAGDPIVYYSSGGAGYTYDDVSGVTTTYASGLGSVIDTTANDFLGYYCSFPLVQVGGSSLDGFITDWNGDNPSNLMPLISDPNSYSCDVTGISADSQPQRVQISFSRTATSITYSSTITTWTDGTMTTIDSTTVYTINRGLLGINDASTVQTNAENLLAYWPLNNSAIYNWRADSYTMYGPKVSRRQVQAEPTPLGFIPHLMDDFTSPIFTGGSISGYNPTAWADPLSFYWIWAPGSASLVASAMGNTHYDGAILGKPFCVDANNTGSITGAPQTGSGKNQVFGWFNFYTDTFRFCKTPVDNPDCGTSPPWELSTYNHGGTLSDAFISTSGIEDGGQLSDFLPNCSTDWTNNLNAHTIPKGASISCGMPNLQGIWVIKYAECRPKYPSYSFFRPCGDDRAAIDETTAQCFIVGDLIMQNALPSTDLILLAFTNGYDGIYSGSSQAIRGDTHYDLTLGTKIRDLPTNYNHVFATEFADNDNWGCYGLVGVVRFPAAWPICGRQNVTVITGSGGSGSIFTFNVGQPNLATNDNITLYDTTMSIVTGTASLFRNSDTEFTSSWNVSSSLSNGSHLMLGWAQSYGSPDYHWDDTAQKLNYRSGSWMTDNRLNIVTSASYDSCVSGSPCAESVVCFSPQLEHFPNGTSTWFNGSTQLDDIYGSIRQLNVEFGVADPLYQVPKKPCSVNGLISPKFQPDNGSCPDDDFTIPNAPILYYPPPRFVEAMVSIPDGAPPLPSNAGWPVMVIPPLPGVVGLSFAAPQQPWQFYFNEVNTCVNNPGCRFISSYACIP